MRKSGGRISWQKERGRCGWSRMDKMRIRRGGAGVGVENHARRGRGSCAGRLTVLRPVRGLEFILTQ